MDCLSEVFSHVEAIRAAVASEVNALELQRAQLDEERAQLNEERKLFELEKKALRDRLHRGSGLVTPLTGNVVELNIGGVPYTTSLTTLLADPDSELATLFRTPSEIPLDADGRFFLDYAGDVFSYVLKYLRGEKFFVKKGDPVVAEVYSLAHKLGLSGFKRIIEKVLSQQKQQEKQQQQQQQQRKQEEVQQQPPPSPKEDVPRAVVIASSPATQPPVPVKDAPPPPQPTQAVDKDMVSLLPAGSDPSLASMLHQVLQRQRTKEAATKGAAALEHVRSEEASNLAENQWEQHWQRLVSTP